MRNGAQQTWQQSRSRAEMNQPIQQRRLCWWYGPVTSHPPYMSTLWASEAAAKDHTLTEHCIWIVHWMTACLATPRGPQSLKKTTYHPLHWHDVSARENSSTTQKSPRSERSNKFEGERRGQEHFWPAVVTPHYVSIMYIMYKYHGYFEWHFCKSITSHYFELGMCGLPTLYCIFLALNWDVGMEIKLRVWWMCSGQRIVGGLYLSALLLQQTAELQANKPHYHHPHPRQIPLQQFSAVHITALTAQTWALRAALQCLTLNYSSIQLYCFCTRSTTQILLCSTWVMYEYKHCPRGTDISCICNYFLYKALVLHYYHYVLNIVIDALILNNTLI